MCETVAVPALRHRLDELGLPPTLAAETALVTVSVLTIGPLVLLTVLDIRPALGDLPVAFAAVGLLALVLLWFALTIHALVDLGRLVRQIPAYRRDGVPAVDRRTLVHLAFRAVEAVGVVVPPVTFAGFVSVFSDAPASGAGPAAVSSVFVVFGTVAVLGAVVLIHALVLVLVGTEGRRPTT
jgi:hypothetical protein